MSTMECTRTAPAPGHRSTISHPVLQSGLDDHSDRPVKRHRSDCSQEYIHGPDEPYVLLSHVQRWWEVRLQIAVSIRHLYDCVKRSCKSTSARERRLNQLTDFLERVLVCAVTHWAHGLESPPASDAALCIRGSSYREPREAL